MTGNKTTRANGFTNVLHNITTPVFSNSNGFDEETNDHGRVVVGRIHERDQRVAEQPIGTTSVQKDRMHCKLAQKIQDICVWRPHTERGGAFRYRI